MEAPSKIYLHPNIGGREFIRPWLQRPANSESVAYIREEHIREVVFAYLQGFSEFAQSTYGVNISAGTITDNIMRNLKGGEE